MLRINKLKTFFAAALLAVSLIPSYELYAQPLHIEDSFEAAITDTEVSFPYQANKIYEIFTKKGFITDIRFEPGEQLKSVQAGDTTRWVIDSSSSGSGAETQQHLYVKPVYEGISTNMIINTTARTYQLLLISGQNYNHTVSWIFERMERFSDSEENIKNYLSIDPQQLDFGYSFNKKELSWAPAKVFNDGKKTYIKMKPQIKTEEMPIFFVVDKKKNPVQVNYRVIKGTYIIDRLFKEARLVIGTEMIKIKRD